MIEPPHSTIWAPALSASISGGTIRQLIIVALAAGVTYGIGAFAGTTIA